MRKAGTGTRAGRWRAVARVFGEFLVSDRVGEREVDRAAEGVVFGDEADSAEPVGEGEDGEVLGAWAQATAEAQAEGEQEQLERWRPAVEDDAGADGGDAAAGRAGGFEGAFPDAYDVGEEAVAEFGVFGEDAVAAVQAVSADAALGDQHRPSLELCGGGGERGCRADPALADEVPVRRSPRPADVRAGQVDDDVGVAERGRIQVATGRVPADFVGVWRAYDGPGG